MKKIILVLVSMVFMGCCLDDQEREDYYIENHTWYVSHISSYTSTEYIYIAISPEGVEYIYVTIDVNSNVYDEDGNYLFNLDD